MHGVSNRTMQRRVAVTAACLASVVAARLSGQTLLAPKPSVQHVTATASVAPGSPSAGKVALRLDVVPKPNIHVYASGSKEFTAVSLVLTPHPGVSLGKPVYPAADPPSEAPGALDDAPAYRKPFRITQPVTVQAVKEDVVVTGVLNYQACDDRLCYPVASLPVAWTIPAR